MMKLNSGLKNQMLAATLGMAIGTISVSAFNNAEEAKAAGIIAEQKKRIKKLTAELRSKDEIVGANENPSVGNREKQTKEETVTISRADHDTLKGQRQFAHSRACQFATIPVRLLTVKRNSCEDSEQLNLFLDTYYAHCLEAYQGSKSDGEKVSIKKFMDDIATLKENPRISPKPCRKEKDKQ